MLQTLQENTTGAANPNIATVDQNISVNDMFQETLLPSLGRQIFSILPMKGPNASIFNLSIKTTVASPEILAVNQVNTATPTAANTTVYTLTINGIAFSYTSDATATVAEITAGLTLEINVTQTNGTVPVTATNNTTSIALTANVAGTSFTVTSTGAGTIGLVLTTPNQQFVAAVLASKDIKLVRAPVEVYPSTSIRTSITNEVVQDIRAMYGKEAEQIIGKLLRGLANADENTKTLAFLEAKAVAYASLTLSDVKNAEVNLLELTQRVQEIVLKINSKNLRTYEAFAVLPYKGLAGLMTSRAYQVEIDDDPSPSGLLVAQYGTTKYFINPDPTSSTAYVGLLDTVDSSKSSAIFSPYTSDVIETQDINTGVLAYHIFNRYAITASPLHVASDEMLYKFTIA